MCNGPSCYELSAVELATPLPSSSPSPGGADVTLAARERSRACVVLGRAFLYAPAGRAHLSL